MSHGNGPILPTCILQVAGPTAEFICSEAKNACHKSLHLPEPLQEHLSSCLWEIYFTCLNFKPWHPAVHKI